MCDALLKHLAATHRHHLQFVVGPFIYIYNVFKYRRVNPLLHHRNKPTQETQVHVQVMSHNSLKTQCHFMEGKKKEEKKSIILRKTRKNLFSPFISQEKILKTYPISRKNLMHIFQNLYRCNFRPKCAILPKCLL